MIVVPYRRESGSGGTMMGELKRAEHLRRAEMAKRIEGIATVDEDGQAKLHVADVLPPGKHRVIVVVDESAVESLDAFLARIAIRGGQWPGGLSLRREDMYGDWGR
jgi:hypothetical protein